MRLQKLRVINLVAMLSVLLIGASARSAFATEVHVNVNIGAPPPIVVRTAPTMVFLPEPAIYTAVAVPYDIYFVSGRYYYLTGDHWFWGPGYGGPWTFIEYRSLPRGLRKYKVVRLHEFRDREYKVYRADGRNFKGEHFVAVYGKENGHQGNGRGRGHAKH